VKFSAGTVIGDFLSIYLSKEIKVYIDSTLIIGASSAMMRNCRIKK
jgi:hypothetical protein